MQEKRGDDGAAAAVNVPDSSGLTASKIRARHPRSSSSACTSRRSERHSAFPALVLQAASRPLAALDSMAFRYRSMPNVASRNRSVASIWAFLADLALEHELAVILVNQTTTKYDFAVGDGGGGRKPPARNNNRPPRECRRGEWRAEKEVRAELRGVCGEHQMEKVV